MKQSLIHLRLLKPSITILLKLPEVHWILHQTFQKKIFWFPSDPKYRIILYYSNWWCWSFQHYLLLKSLSLLLNIDISDQLSIFFNQYFPSGIFSSISKTSKFIPIYKKFLNYVQTIDQFLCYVTLKKFWRDSCITDFITF